MPHIPSHSIVGVADYEPLVGAETIERIQRKAATLRDAHIVHINSTYYGGGVAELLSSLTLLMNDLGVQTGWRVIQGRPDFFSITKKMHNALQGGEINLTDLKLDIYEDVIRENAIRNHLDHDIVVIHDPQPLPMIRHYRRRGPWVWRCHVELSQPHPDLWRHLRGHIERYDAVVVSIPEYEQPDLTTPQVVIPPALDPFSPQNRELTAAEIDERLAHYQIPTDRPLVVQVSRFDRWKDPEGVIAAFKMACREVDATLVLLGNVATDDPEGAHVFEALLNQRDERIILICQQDTALVNALQRRAAVVLQKSLREGFGLTVTEAMWKGTPVIGGAVGGIRHQIQDGVNGYLVSSVAEAAERIVRLLRDRDLGRRLGERARQTVRERYLLTHSLEAELDLYNAFEARYSLSSRSRAAVRSMTG